MIYMELPASRHGNILHGMRSCIGSVGGRLCLRICMQCRDLENVPFKTEIWKVLADYEQ
jgi:hypothetical protein